MNVFVCYFVEVFSKLCEQHLPELHTHLVSIQILTMLSVAWFLTLFITVLNYHDAASIIDCFFVDGSKVYYTLYTVDHIHVSQDILLFHKYDKEFTNQCHTLVLWNHNYSGGKNLHK